jgi:DDE superfamily endonuclease
LIEAAYLCGEALGLAVWTEDEAGPFQTVPYPGSSWQPEAHPDLYPHEHLRLGTAKMLTLFHPASGQARVLGVTNSPNTVLHPWLQTELSAILAAQAAAPGELSAEANRAEWRIWQAGLTVLVTLPTELPRLRMLLILDNLAGHHSGEFVLWCIAHGIMPLYTPLSGSWLNMAESFQRIIQRRALEGQHPQSPAEIIRWLEATVAGWNAAPTPFEWGGKRAARRARSRARRHALGGSGAVTRCSIHYRPTPKEKWTAPCQTTH